MFMSTAVSLYFLTTDTGNPFTNRLTASDIPRLENIDHAKRLLAERGVNALFIGTGNGSYEAFSPTGFSAHNTYLRLLVENGVLGLLLFLAFLGAIITLTFRYKRDIITHAALVSILGIIIHSAFIDTLHWRHFWLLLGLL